MTLRDRSVFVIGLLVAALSLAAGNGAAQTTTGTIRGYVTTADRGPVSGAEIVARNVETGVERRATSRIDGAYTLPGLVPAPYDLTVRSIGMRPQARRVVVQIGATALVDFALEAGAVELEAVTVVAAPVVETRTSEVATNVTQQQIASLPTTSRNFLDLASLAPGTTIENDRLDGTSRRLRAGAQSADQINVFIDGVSYKNDLIHGGLVGQDRSRGNPFLRNAVQEYRVITQNFKAEYQKSSSAIVTAVTRSGTNEWRGNAFFSYQSQGLVALDTFARVTKENDPNFREPDYSRYLAGLSVGGPIIRDRLHVFGAYEGNYQDRDRRVTIVPPTGFPALDTIDFASRSGLFLSPFRSTSVFGKLSYAAGAHASLEATVNVRHETDTRDFGDKRPFESGVRFRNDVATAGVKFTYAPAEWLNEFTLSYQRARDNPSPVPGDQTVNRFFGGAFCCAQLGPDVTIQDFIQRRFALRNDLTHSGLRWSGAHVVKGGVSLDFLNYSIVKRNGTVPRYVYEEIGHDAAQPDSFRYPDRVEFRGGNPNFLADNVQFGVYVQDDWSPVPQLTFNLGIRWDYESRMMNFDYVTPQPVRDSLTKYADRLFLPLDPERYFTDGTQRPRYKGAVQPRLGFSYAIDRAGKTTAFGGWGIYYDRTLFDIAIEEEFAQRQPNIVLRFRLPGDATPGRIDWDDRYFGDRAVLDSLRIANPQAGAPEVKLLPNDLRPPKSQHFNVGVRRVIGPFVAEAAYTGVRSKNVFTFYWANMNFTCPERSFGVPGCFVNNAIPGFSTILFGTNAGKTWYDALQVRLDRPYRPSASGGLGWGASLAYTYAERETEGFNDDFSFPNPVDYPRQVRNDEEHRLVANWTIDVPYAYGIQLGGLLTVGSAANLDVGDRFGRPGNPLQPGGFDVPAFKNLDLRLNKEFPRFGRSTLGVTLDMFNVFDWQNLGCYNTGNPSDTANFGKAFCVTSDPRRLQLGVEYGF